MTLILSPQDVRFLENDGGGRSNAKNDYILNKKGFTKIIAKYESIRF